MAMNAQEIRLMSRQRLAVVCAGALVAGVLCSAPGIQAASAGTDIPYSAAQAAKGKTIFGAQCAMCHMADLTGMGQSPALSGDEFLDKYSDQPISVLFKKIQRTMPATAPGSLSESDTAAVLAYMLSANGYAAGAADLPRDEDSLKKIPLVKAAKK
jgi:mono/diheme cytochrome c family protein